MVVVVGAFARSRRQSRGASDRRDQEGFLLKGIGRGMMSEEVCEGLDDTVVTEVGT